MTDINAPAKERKGWKRRVLRIVVGVVVVYAVYLGALMGFQERLIFPRDLPGKRDPAGRVPGGFEQLVVTGDDGSKVPAWLRMPKLATGQRAPVVMFFHGNAEVIDDIAQTNEVQMYPSMGVGVLVVEYRGYGRAGGAPSQRAMAADGVKMYDLLVSREDVDRDRIVFYGRSLGGGAACAVARERKPKAMILQSTFTSASAMSAKMWVPGFLVRHPFRNDEVVSSLDVPMLFMHGLKDSIIPCTHSKTLAAMAKHGRLVNQDCDHNDFPIDSEGYRREIEAFLRETGVIQ